MPRSAGTYTLPAGNPVVTGTVISSTVQNNTMNDVATALTDSLPRDGTAPPTANIPMNNFKFTGLGTANAAGNALVFGQADAQLEDLYMSGQQAAISTAVGASAVDCSLGNYFTKTAAGALTWTFTNVPATGRAYGFVLELANGGTGTQTWPTSVKWPGGSAPQLRASATDVLVFVTRDNGTTWRANLSIPNTAT